MRMEPLIRGGTNHTYRFCLLFKFEVSFNVIFLCRKGNTFDGYVNQKHLMNKLCYGWEGEKDMCFLQKNQTKKENTNKNRRKKKERKEKKRNIF